MATSRKYKIIRDTAVTREITRIFKAHPEITLSSAARKMNLANANVLTMFQQGETRLPMEQVIPLCKAFGESPNTLFEAVFSEAHPEVAKYVVFNL